LLKTPTASGRIPQAGPVSLTVSGAGTTIRRASGNPELVRQPRHMRGAEWETLNRNDHG
jgi:hypothetical protein